MVLDDLWGYQRQFANKVNLYFTSKDINDLEHQERITISKDYILSLIGECKEVLDNFEWKLHRKKYGKFDREGLIEELVDCQKFLWGLIHIWNISLDEFIHMFKEKSDIVEQRWIDEQC